VRTVVSIEAVHKRKSKITIKKGKIKKKKMVDCPKKSYNHTRSIKIKLLT
jgi:hypothetical protein